MKRWIALGLMLALALTLLAGCGKGDALPQEGEASPFVTDAPAQTAQQVENPRVGMWISYLEWINTDFSSQEAFTAQFSEICEKSAAMGVNVLYVQVRPFGDAFYKSEIYPWSNYITGTQGQDPGYDPLAIMVELAHGAGLEIEAWINPYRIQLNSTYPGCALSQDNPAVLNPQRVKTVGEGLYYDPSLPEIRQMVVDGVVEILENYAVDGIHLDDYFYPTTDPSFDAGEYQASGTSLPLEEWRRENVSALVSQLYAAVKETAPDCRFGISPQGNPDNNYQGQYSDVGLWMTEEGYLDYVLPQVYWGFGYQLSGGSTRFAFENITAEWMAMPRREGVELMFGLGAYRIGDGDGGANQDSVSQWNTGHNLADQADLALEQGADGYALYRYDFLGRNSAWPDLAQQEVQALTQLNGVA